MKVRTMSELQIRHAIEVLQQVQRSRLYCQAG